MLVYNSKLQTFQELQLTYLTRITFIITPEKQLFYTNALLRFSSSIGILAIYTPVGMNNIIVFERNLLQSIQLSF